MSGVVDVAGVRVLLEATDEAHAAVVSRVLRLLPQASSTPDVDVRFSARRPALPRRPPDKASEGVGVWFDGDVFHLDLPSGARARVNSASAWLGTGDEDAARAFELLFAPALTHLLAFRERFVLHAGGVIGARGAYLVLGASGRGKSTLAAAALEHGWRVLGDDMIAIRSDADVMLAAGIPRRVAVPGELGSRLAGTPLPDDPRGRFEVPGDMLEQGWFPVAGTIVVGHGSSAHSVLRTITGIDTLRVLLDAYRSSVNPAHLRRFFADAASLSRLPAWELLHNADPGSRLTEAGRALAAIAEASGAQSTAPTHILS